MMLEEFFDYKNQLMKDICSNEKIVKLITDKTQPTIPDFNLPYSQVYPYEFVPETIDHGQTFICFDVDIAQVLDKTFYVPVLYVWVFTHKSKIQLPEGGIRTDKLAAETDAILNGSRYFGLGELDLKNVGRFSPITDYQGRVLTYHAKDFNRSGSKQPPSNRKNY